MFRIAICDDDIPTLESVYKLVKAYADAHPETEFLIRRFHSVYDLLECLESRERNFHIYLLDILMPLLNGIELGVQIRKNDMHAAILYLTTSPEYALESFKASPVTYLIKPVEQEPLFAALDRCRSQLQQTMDTHVLVRVKDGLTNIRFYQIVYAEYLRHAIVFHLSGGRTVQSMVLRESFTAFAQKYLADPRFIRPHASYIVNMDYVQALTANDFELTDGSSIPISRRVYSQIKKMYMDYLLTGNEVSLL